MSKYTTETENDIKMVYNYRNEFQIFKSVAIWLENRKQPKLTNLGHTVQLFNIIIIYKTDYIVLVISYSRGENNPQPLLYYNFIKFAVIT